MPKSRFLHSRFGASYIEATLVIPLFFLFVFFIFDVARFFLIAIILNWAAHDAADWVSKQTVEVNTVSSACDLQKGCSEAGGEWFNPCVQYKKVLTDAIDRALNHARVVVSDSATPSGAQLVSLTHYQASDYNTCDLPNRLMKSGIEPFTADVGIQRPGERLVSAAQEIFEHPTRPCIAPSGDGAQCGELSGYGPPGPGENWTKVMEDNPIVVRMLVKYTPLTPLFPSFEFSVIQMAYRTPRLAGIGLPGVPPPTVTPTPTSTCAVFEEGGIFGGLEPMCNLDPLFGYALCTTCVSAGCGTCEGRCKDTCQQQVDFNCGPSGPPCYGGAGAPCPCQSATDACLNAGCPIVIPTPYDTFTPTATRTPTNTPTPTETATETPTMNGTATETNTPAPTATRTNTRTPTPPTNTPTTAPTPTPPAECFEVCASAACSPQVCHDVAAIGYDVHECCTCCSDYGLCDSCPPPKQ